MNKIYKFFTLFFAFSALTTLVNAQTWTAPSYKSEVPVAGTAYYVYNVGAKGFLNRGGDWGTHCAVSASPTANASVQTVKWKIAEPVAGQFTFEYVKNDVASNTFIFHPGDWDVWGDAAATSTERNFLLSEVDATNHIMTIQKDVFVGLDKFMGWSGYSQSTNKGTSDMVFTDKAAGGDNVKWKFVTQANYDLYKAQVELDKYMNYAKLKGGIDLTSYIATYNAGVTADITTAAANLLTALGRTDVTSSILNPSFESNSFASWTNSGSFALQSNSPIFTKNGTYYAEKYVGSGSNLGVGTITQTISGLSNGLYGVVMGGHAVQQAGSNPLHTGAYVTAGTSSTEVLSIGDHSVEYVPVIDGTLTIGYKLQTPVASNWVGFDNFRLYYYGTTAIPTMSSNQTSLYFKNLSDAVKVFNVTGANLTGNISISAPTGVTLTGTNLVNNGGGSYTILAANANVSNAITATWDGVASIANVNIVISESEVSTVNVSVEASKDEACYTPMYSWLTNLITDPFMTDLSKFGGWGNKSIVIDPAVAYCGSRCAFINGTAVCWPNSGSIDASIAWQPNKTYRIKAMVKAVNGTMNMGVSNEANVSGGSDFSIPQSDTWVEFTKDITTGANATSGLCFFNGCGASTGFIGYIDNWEIYDITSVITSDIRPTENNVNAFVRDNRIVVKLNVVNIENAEAFVYSANGMLLSAQQLNMTSGVSEKQLNAELQSGVYIVQVVTDGKSYTYKVIK